MKIKALLYCTKELNKGAYLVNFFGYRFVKMEESEKANFDILNGKIVCECEVETEEIVNSKLFNNYATWKLGYKELLNKSNLTEREIIKYLGTQNKPHKVYKQYSCNCGYALHLSNVKERVMELNQVYKRVNYRSGDNGLLKLAPLEKAPQNMMWVYIYENGEWVKYLLISVRPQWLCKILNKQKDIEVRRKVLKGMCD